mgnify:CR=1 FL=1
MQSIWTHNTSLGCVIIIYKKLFLSYKLKFYEGINHLNNFYGLAVKCVGCAQCAYFESNCLSLKLIYNSNKRTWMSTNTDIDSLNLPGELTANGKQQYFIYCLYVRNSQSSRDILLKQTLKHIRSTPSTSTNCIDLFITNQLYMHTVVAIKKTLSVWMRNLPQGIPPLHGWLTGQSNVGQPWNCLQIKEEWCGVKTVF